MNATSLRETYRRHIETLTEQSQKILAADDLEAMVIHSGGLTKRSLFDDQYWTLNPVPHFAHWLDLAWPDSALVISRKGQPRLIARDSDSYWEQLPDPDWELLESALEVETVTDESTLLSHLPKSGAVFIGEDRALSAAWGFESDEQFNPESIIGALHELRVFKTAYEIECMSEASRIAVAGHKAVRDAFVAGERSEFQLHLRYLSATNQDDDQTPYKNIIALGAAGAVLHYVDYRKDSVAADSLLIDAGAKCRGYASDITRTYAAPGDSEGHQRFADLVSRVDQMQRDIIDRIEIGMPYQDLHDQCHQMLGQVLHDAEIVKMSPEAAVESGVTRKFLPHGLGHSLGVQVHDVGCRRVAPRRDNEWLRNTRTIEAGQVFTIEPGLYFIDTLLAKLRAGPEGKEINWDRIETLRPFGGIRIEDNIHVLPAGSGPRVRNLTRERWDA